MSTGPKLGADRRDTFHIVRTRCAESVASTIEHLRYRSMIVSYDTSSRNCYKGLSYPVKQAIKSSSCSSTSDGGASHCSRSPRMFSERDCLTTVLRVC